MTRLILVKHSTPAINASVPAREWTLSAEGQARARRLAGLLSQHQPEVIVSSVEPKAQETAEILANTFGLTYQVVADLHEHNRSNVPYYSNEEFQELIRTLFESPDVLVFGQETARQALTRFSTAVNAVLSAHPQKTTVIVTHGTVLALFVAQLTGVDGHTLWGDLGLPSFVILDLPAKALLETVNLP